MSFSYFNDFVQKFNDLMRQNLFSSSEAVIFILNSWKVQPKAGAA